MLGLIGGAPGAQDSAGRFRGLRYLGEIGHLNTALDKRAAADLGFAKAVAVDSGTEFSGYDDAGKKWVAQLPVAGGLGWTTVWTGDFDRNSRPDLMVASSFPSNGRCVRAVTISFLMFDAQGRPNPWTVRTQMPGTGGFQTLPAIVSGLGSDAHAELVAVDCRAGDSPDSGQDFSIAGVYEARDAGWRLVPAQEHPTYDRITRIVARSYVLQKGRDRLVAIDSAHWQNPGNDREPNSQPVRELSEVLPADPSCSRVDLGQIRDGRVTPSNPDVACNDTGMKRLRLSDGTICYGWPTVVFDRRVGREIVEASSERTQSILQEIADRRLPVSPVGQVFAGRCSPVSLRVSETR